MIEVYKNFKHYSDYSSTANLMKDNTIKIITKTQLCYDLMCNSLGIRNNPRIITELI